MGVLTSNTSRMRLIVVVATSTNRPLALTACSDGNIQRTMVSR